MYHSVGTYANHKPMNQRLCSCNRCPRPCAHPLRLGRVRPSTAFTPSLIRPIFLVVAPSAHLIGSFRSYVIVIKVSGTLAVSCHPGSGRAQARRQGYASSSPRGRNLQGPTIETERRYRLTVLWSPGNLIGGAKGAPMWLLKPSR